MTEVELADDKLVVRVVGWDKVWSLKSSLEIPLRHITGVHAAPEHVRGIRAPGTYIPGVITAGTFHLDGDKIFWDVHDPAKAIAIDLQHDLYAQLVIEVADPAAAMTLIENALKRRPLPPSLRP